MPDFILLMHDDTQEPVRPDLWPPYFAKLREAGVLQGGSAIGRGETVRKDGKSKPPTDHLSGYIRLSAENLAEAKALIHGNPVLECGGTVEICALPRD